MVCCYVHAMQLTDLPDDVLIHIISQGYKSRPNNTEREDFATIMKSVSYKFFTLSKSAEYAREMRNNVGDLAFVNVGEYFSHMAGNATKFSSDYLSMRSRLLRANAKKRGIVWAKKHKVLSISGNFLGNAAMVFLLARLFHVSSKKSAMIGSGIGALTALYQWNNIRRLA